jgi:uncharacterized protein YcbK (DUF882 family)
MNDCKPTPRRQFLRRVAGLAAAGAVPATCLPAHAGELGAARALTMLNTHTGERIELVYAVGARFLPDALGTLNHFLRDHYSGAVGVMDPAVFDLVHRVQAALGVVGRSVIEVISGYRSPATNAFLKKTRGGGVANHSLHMDGQAIDLRLAGVPLGELRDAALSLRGGGVGFYPDEGFVHVDTGRVRSW